MGYQPPPGAAASGEWLAAAAAWPQSAVSSERAAWAAQNAVGALFAAIFVVVLDLQFTLACLCGVLFRCAQAAGGGSVFCRRWCSRRCGIYLQAHIR